MYQRDPDCEQSDVPPLTQLPKRALEIGTAAAKTISNKVKQTLELPALKAGKGANSTGTTELVATQGKTITTEQSQLSIEAIVAAQSKEVSELRGTIEFITKEVSALHEEMTERNKTLEVANTRLRELDELKNRFVADAAHELRNPISNLLIKLDLMERGKPENRDQYAKDMRGQIRRLSNLIEDILDLTRLYDADLSLQFSSLDLNTIVRETCNLMRDSAATKELTLNIELADNLPELRGEVSYLMRLVENLVANAIKYTLVGSVTVRTEHHANVQSICLVIRDTGIGITPYDISQLFKRFHRGQTARDNGIPGTGLGLAIVKEIAELHSGEITVESEVAKGTTFRVWLPLAR
jgi:signal transduction histidine kinase